MKSLPLLQDFRFSIVSQGFEDLLGYSIKELEQKEPN